MVTFLLSTVGLATVGAYCYMGVLTGWGAKKAGASLVSAVVKGATWPATMYWVMKDLYNVKPNDNG